MIEHGQQISALLLRQLVYQTLSQYQLRTHRYSS